MPVGLEHVIAEGEETLGDGEPISRHDVVKEDFVVYEYLVLGVSVDTIAAISPLRDVCLHQRHVVIFLLKHGKTKIGVGEALPVSRKDVQLVQHLQNAFFIVAIIVPIHYFSVMDGCLAEGLVPAQTGNPSPKIVV